MSVGLMQIHGDRFLFGQQQVRKTVTIEIFHKNSRKTEFRVQRKIPEGAIIYLTAK